MNYPTIDREQAIAHLEALGYTEGDSVYLRLFVPKEDPRSGSPDSARNVAATFPNIPWKKLEDYQGDGYGVYFVVNGGGNSDADVKQGRAVFIEHDNLDKELQRDLWQAIGLPEPTIQVETRKSVHTYWVTDTTVTDWRSLQTDLLNHADADKTLKNPSRVMRLAGCWHCKPGEAPVQCSIISCSGSAYNYVQLRVAIPKPVAAELPLFDRHSHSGEAIPLEQCLTLSDRALIEQGVGEGLRNHSGAKLARNLIGTETYLGLMRHPYDGSARSLFDYFCSRCTPAIDAKEADLIWRSAEKDKPGPSLSAPAIENCIEAWNRKQAPKAQREPGTVQTPVEEAYPNEAIAPELAGPIDLLPQNDPYQKFLDSLKPLVQIQDLNEQEFRLEQICKGYRVNQQLGKRIFSGMVDGSKEKAKTSYSLDEIFDIEDEALDWLIPGFLPMAELVLCAGQPKAGKSLLGVYEAAFAVATGGQFLNAQCRQGRVLIYQTEESPGTIKRRTRRRGFEPLRKKGLVHFETEISLLNLEAIADKIAEFRPTLVIIDSLRNALAESDAPPGSSEYARPVRRLQKLLMSAGVAGILIHHEKKADGVSKGINKVADTLDISAACWGIWQIEKAKPEDPRDPYRKLSLTPRDGEGAEYEMRLQQGEDSSWCYEFCQELGISWELGETERIVRQTLCDVSPRGLTKQELRESIKPYIPHNFAIPEPLLFRALNRMTERSLISYRPSITDGKTWVYAVPSSTAPAETVAVASYDSDYGEDF